MFSGIVKAVAPVKKAERRSRSLFLRIGKPVGWTFVVGDSVAVNGVCLTVLGVGQGWFEAELVPETLRKTTFGRRAPEQVNLEPALRVGDRLCGHFVQGHVDTTGVVVSVASESRARLFTVSFPREFSSLVAPKGSVAVDGVSLTVVQAGPDKFSFALTPYTLDHTTLGALQNRDLVNIEFDQFAKYVVQALKLEYKRQRDDSKRPKTGF